MNSKSFIEQTVSWLSEKQIPYKFSEDADIKISAKFKTKYDNDDDTFSISYLALIFLDSQKNTIIAYEEAIPENKEKYNSMDLSKVYIATTDESDSFIALATILDSIASIAKSLGIPFEKTDNKQSVLQPPGYLPFDSENLNARAESEKALRFCKNCQKSVAVGERYCPFCGTDLLISQSDPSEKKAIPIKQEQEPLTIVNNIDNKTVKKPNLKSSKSTNILIGILIIIGAIVIGITVYSFINEKNDPSGNPDTLTSAEYAEDHTNSAVVSLGVNPLDIGNIMSGQYYFSTDDNIFYSSFDESDKAHIYAANKDGTDQRVIFDGFGWSLVVIDDWLYFSGNQGEAIDGSYNIFRIKFDGSQVEKVNDRYSYGMFFYDNYLYFMRENDDHQTSTSICRSSLDGQNEEILFEFGKYPVIYNSKLYYFDNSGNMFSTNPDGTDPNVLLQAVVKAYVISEDKIVYLDNDNNIYTCDLDGKNNTLIREATDAPINNINAYNGRVFFSEYNPDFNYSSYGYDYNIKSCNMDGSDEKAVFSSVSYGIYMNLVNNVLMLMDYNMNQSTGIMSATIKAMDFDGNNIRVLPR